MHTHTHTLLFSLSLSYLLWLSMPWIIQPEDFSRTMVFASPSPGLKSPSISSAPPPSHISLVDATPSARERQWFMIGGGGVNRQYVSFLFIFDCLVPYSSVLFRFACALPCISRWYIRCSLTSLLPFSVYSSFSGQHHCALSCRIRVCFWYSSLSRSMHTKAHVIENEWKERKCGCVRAIIILTCILIFSSSSFSIYCLLLSLHLFSLSLSLSFSIEFFH